MRTRIFLVAILTIFVFSGAICNKDDIKKNIKVNVPLTVDYDLTIPTVDKIDTTIILKASEDIDVNQLIQDENSSLGDKNIKSVKIDSVVIEIHQDSRDYGDDNLTSFKSLDAYLSSTTFPTSFLIANVGQPSNKYREVLPVEKNIDVDLLKYVDANAFNLKLNLQTNRAVTNELNATVSVTFMIEAGLGD